MINKKIHRIDSPFPAVSIDNFIPSEALVRAAAASFDSLSPDEWVRYESESGQVQYCSKIPRQSTPEALMVLDYIATHFDPNKIFSDFNTKAFPDTTHYGGGMMLTPNSNGQGGYLGMHVDASAHGLRPRWKREYSAILCISEEYDESFDLLIHDGDKKHARIPYKFNRLNVFKCSKNSWHGLPEITKGLDRKTLGVMYWSIVDPNEDDHDQVKAQFRYDLEFK
jgi:hypothetical protein